MQSDEALYLEAREGSKMAFETLYLRYERPLYGYLLRRLGNEQDAEDIFHEAMLAIVKSPELDFPRPGAFAGWLYKVALNLSLNRVRSGTRERLAFTLLQNEPRPHWEEEDQKPQWLAKAAEDLSVPLGEVYRLRVAGKNYEEMADQLKVPIGTVKSRMHLLVAQLRKGMEKWTVK